MIGESLRAVLNNMQDGERLLVGIDGLSGSGKTTLAKQFASELDKHGVRSTVLHLDDLITVRKMRYQTGHAEWYEHYFLQWDVASLAERVFRSWERGATELELDVYDADRDLLTARTVRVPDRGILLIEGVFLQRKEWRSFFDHVIYIDCPRSTRFARVTGRGGQDIADQERIERYRRRYWAAEDYYLDTEKPLQQADRVVRSSEVADNSSV